MVKKTYGINGLIEYLATFYADLAKMTVTFSGGTFTGIGMKPATYTTENPVKQAIIENSPEFKKGRIFLYSQEGESEQEEAEATVEESSVAEEAKTMRVEVSDLQAAKDYLVEKCGANRASLKTKQSIIDTAKVNGIEFEGI